MQRSKTNKWPNKTNINKIFIISKHMLKKKAIKRSSLMEYLVQSTEKRDYSACAYNAKKGSSLKYR